jgi:hypothetical protein
MKNTPAGFYFVLVLMKQMWHKKDSDIAQIAVQFYEIEIIFIMNNKTMFK